MFVIIIYDHNYVSYVELGFQYLVLFSMLFPVGGIPFSLVEF